MSFKNILFLLSMVFCFNFISAQAKENKKTDWVTFHYATQLNEENVKIKFPHLPQEQNAFWSSAKLFVAKENEVEYIFEISSKEDELAIKSFDDVLSKEISIGYILSYKTYKKDGYSMCDIESMDLDAIWMSKIRVIASSKCNYIIKTTFMVGAEQQHETFVNSFKIN